MAPRNSRVTNTEVFYGFWLVFEEAGGVRLAHTEPNLDRAERAMFLQARLPRYLWSTPTLRGEITFTGQQPITKIDIATAAHALRSTLGVDIDLKVIEP